MATKEKSQEPPKPNPAMLNIDERYLLDGDKERLEKLDDYGLTAAITARALHQPEVRAARTIQRFEGDSLNINSAVNELRELVAEVQGGSMKRPEAMLVAQAHTLDALFSALAMRSKANSDGGFLDAADRYLRLALKAQAQAVRTIEALGELKNPRAVAFVKQANISHGHQQVNNGVQAGNPSAHGNNPIQSNELSGASNELLPDTRASTLASRIDTPVEAVAELDRAAN
jgi:hypothetical protein